MYIVLTDEPSVHLPALFSFVPGIERRIVVVVDWRDGFLETFGSFGTERRGKEDLWISETRRATSCEYKREEVERVNQLVYRMPFQTWRSAEGR
jgi:hypothetical protein